jgi:hypothetical protein
MDPTWSLYVGVATGVIGAITGIAGAIMGWIAYRRSNQIQKADRRLELHKLRNTTHVAVVGLVELIATAQRSRRAILNARGLSSSNTMDHFQDKVEKDGKRANELASQVPVSDESFSDLSGEKIDELVIQLHRTKEWVDEMVREYQGHLGDDEKWRSELRKR